MKMTGIEFKARREYLGLDQDWIAARLGLTSERQVRRWESGDAPIPEGVRHELDQWEAATAAEVDAISAALDDPPTLALPRDDDAWPARWHRHVGIRVAQRVTGLAITER